MLKVFGNFVKSVCDIFILKIFTPSLLSFFNIDGEDDEGPIVQIILILCISDF